MYVFQFPLIICFIFPTNSSMKNFESIKLGTSLLVPLPLLDMFPAKQGQKDLMTLPHVVHLNNKSTQQSCLHTINFSFTLQRKLTSLAFFYTHTSKFLIKLTEQQKFLNKNLDYTNQSHNKNKGKYINLVLKRKNEIM